MWVSFLHSQEESHTQMSELSISVHASTRKHGPIRSFSIQGIRLRKRSTSFTDFGTLFSTSSSPSSCMASSTLPTWFLTLNVLQTQGLRTGQHSVSHCTVFSHFASLSLPNVFIFPARCGSALQGYTTVGKTSMQCHSDLLRRRTTHVCFQEVMLQDVCVY